ncbi:MAG: glutamate--tRNA ligase, partial [Deltaproteobacteria bacterium]|nr:glutamate--tRNA ligase [Deltaproteobacteria bacterium]
DTDQARSTREAEAAIYRALRWAGLDWDEGPDKGGPDGPYRQSERLPIYRDHVERLIAGGHAYRCTCSAERLERVRQQQEADKASVRGYDGHCRERQVEVAAEIEAGAPYVVRLKVPRGGSTVVHDELRGDIEVRNEEIDDQVLLKSDGFPTYHLANVVDDHLMGITHVLRGEEWIKSTHKHVLLYQAFGWELPVFAHLPLLRNADKSKVSKRKNPTSLIWYEQAGILPQALLNFLGMMGWGMPDGSELFSVEEMIRHFELGQIHLGGPVFDIQKLIWLNGKYLREKLTDEQVIDRILETIVDRDRLRQIVPLCKERVDKLEDFFPYAGFFFGPFAYDEAFKNAIVPKKWDRETTKQVLLEVAESVDAQFTWNKETIEKLLRDYCEKTQRKSKEVFMAVRVAVTGKAATPPLFETMAVLGRELCRRRLREAHRQLDIVRLSGQVEISMEVKASATK